MAKQGYPCKEMSGRSLVNAIDFTISFKEWKMFQTEFIHHSNVGSDGNGNFAHMYGFTLNCLFSR